MTTQQTENTTTLTMPVITTPLTFTLDRLKGQLTPRDPLTIKRVHMRNIAAFRCNCNQELKISKEDVRKAGAWESSTGQLRSPIYESVMEHYNRARDLNDLASQLNKHKVDFIQYFQKLERLKKKWQLRTETIERLAAGSTDLKKECWNCRKTYTFRLKMQSPIDPEEPHDPITVFRQVGIKDTEANRLLLARKLREDEMHGAPYRDFPMYVAYLTSLDATVQWIQHLVNRAKADLKKGDEPPSDHGRRFLQELNSSLEEMCQTACKEVEDALKRMLRSLEELCAATAFHQT